jgi:3-methylfumaryl-CoA hydratase
MIDIAHLKSWIGLSEESSDVATAAPLEGLAALLDHETPPWIPGQLPPLGHWLYFLPHARQSEIDADGHTKRGGFMPPVPLPRRMLAGNRIGFQSAIPIGAAMTRRSTIESVEAKSGASGEMVFVTVRHDISVDGALAITEHHDIVYREAPKAGTASQKSAQADAPESEWTRTITPDPVQLFRYSALTFNGHRIHYDRDYCRGVEGYPGLVVHGPYTATLLVDHYLRHRPGSRIAKLSFRAPSPLFDTAPFTLCGRKAERGADLWAAGPSGQRAMTLALETA